MEEKYYKQLIGGTITGFAFHKDAEDNNWPRYWVRLKTGKVLIVEVSQDAEGNGPGFLFMDDGSKG
jgi:hypothetical protein